MVFFRPFMAEIASLRLPFGEDGDLPSLDAQHFRMDLHQEANYHAAGTSR